MEADLIELIEHLPLSTPLPDFLKQELSGMLAGLTELPDVEAGEDPRTAGDRRLTDVSAIIANSPALMDALRLRGSRYRDELAAILEDRVPAELGPIAARARRVHPDPRHHDDRRGNPAARRGQAAAGDHRVADRDGPSGPGPAERRALP